MPFLLKELVKAGGYIILLTLALYYFADNTLSTAFIIALVCQVTLFILTSKKLKMVIKLVKNNKSINAAHYSYIAY